ncbi:MAG TPA: histidine kinase [Rubrivivax sp.]|nr:histidine kinase [Rubrivivax sp.]
MPTAFETPPVPDQPLPDELTGRAQGWLARYRRWPVFSAPWARARIRAWSVPVGLALVFIAGGAALASHEGLPWAAVLGVALDVVPPLLVGPWVGVWVRRRAWPAAHEGWALLAAMGLVAVVTVAVTYVAAEPLKQWIAERIGDVDESGQRRMIALQIGVTVRPADRPASAAALPEPEPPPAHGSAVNLATRALLAFWMAGGFAVIGWRRERAALAALAREKALAQALAARREAELRLSVLAAQVEPHFLFNTLAGVRSAIATDPPRASEMVDRLVDYLRAAIPRLRSDGGSATTLAGQLDIVRAYLGLMAARMPRLAWTIDVAPELLSAPCPPLMLISLAENAVKHGVEPKIGPVHVAVRAARTADGRLEITVADDGAGFTAASSGGGLGLANIRERLQQMYGGRAALALKARPEGGVAAILTLPMDEENACPPP